MKKSPSVPGANKTFGIRYPTELLAKLMHDLERLKQAKFSREANYAIFDCASDAWHLVDWCLAYASDAQMKSWTGLERNARRGHTAGFVTTNAKALPHLGYCQQIANSFKHLVVHNHDEYLISHNSVRFDPPFQAYVMQDYKMSPVGRIEHLQTGEQIEAVKLFEDIATQWAAFLKQEGLDFAPDDLEVLIQELLPKR